MYTIFLKEVVESLKAPIVQETGFALSTFRAVKKP
jgi:hypothetical protein